MASTRTAPSSDKVPYNMPPRLIENWYAAMTYCWNALAAWVLKDTDAHFEVSCLQSTDVHQAPETGHLQSDKGDLGEVQTPMTNEQVFASASWPNALSEYADTDEGST